MSLIDTICDKQFTTSDKGFSPKEVDEFLDEVCDEIEFKLSETNIGNDNSSSRATHITSDDLEKKQFSIVANGYNIKEVRSFLQSIATEMGGTVTVNDQARRQPMSNTQDIENNKHVHREQEAKYNLMKDPICIIFLILGIIVFVTGIIMAYNLASTQFTELVGVYNPQYVTKKEFDVSVFMSGYLPYLSASCLSFLIAIVSYRLKKISFILQGE